MARREEGQVATIPMGTTSIGERGQNAERPSEIPMKGWKDIGWRVKDQLRDDHVSIVAAGIAFYFFLAIFPAIGAALSLYGLVMDPAQIARQLGQLANALPEQAHELISDILNQQSERSGSALGWSLILSVLIGLWSANKGTKAVFEGINIAYTETDGRGIVKRNAVTLVFTLGGLVVGFVVITTITVLPAIINGLGLPSVVENVIALLRWPVLALLAMAALAAVYRVAPHRESPGLRWTSWGAVIATMLWLAGSLAFSFFVSHFGRFDETYGGFAAVIILMLWFFLTGFIVLLGAEINAQMEHQTRRDAVTGEGGSAGQRGVSHAGRHQPRTT